MTVPDIIGITTLSLTSIGNASTVVAINAPMIPIENGSDLVGKIETQYAIMIQLSKQARVPSILLRKKRCLPKRRPTNAATVSPITRNNIAVINIPGSGKIMIATSDANSK